MLIRKSGQVGWTQSNFTAAATEEQLKKALHDWESQVMRANIELLNKGVDPAWLGEWLVNQGLGIAESGLKGLDVPEIHERYPDITWDEKVRKMGGNVRGFMERLTENVKNDALLIGGKMGDFFLPKSPGKPSIN